MKALLYVHIFVSGGRQLCSLLYPVRQLYHVRRVYAEEDVQDFRQLRPGLDSPQVVVLFLTSPKFSAIAWSGIANNHTFDMQIYFAIPPNSAFHGLLEEFLFIYQKFEMHNILTINLLGNIYISKQSLTIICSVRKYRTSAFAHLCAR